MKTYILVTSSSTIAVVAAMTLAVPVLACKSTGDKQQKSVSSQQHDQSKPCPQKQQTQTTNTSKPCPKQTESTPTASTETPATPTQSTPAMQPTAVVTASAPVVPQPTSLPNAGPANLLPYAIGAGGIGYIGNIVRLKRKSANQL
jgi:hypothetical protein